MECEKSILICEKLNHQRSNLRRGNSTLLPPGAVPGTQWATIRARTKP